MIDPATGWIEIVPVDNKEPSTIAHIVETNWLCKYPWPQEIVYDRGTEFLKEFGEMIVKDYGIKKDPFQLEIPKPMPYWKGHIKL